MLLIPVLCFNWAPDQISIAENRPLAELGSPKNGLSVFMSDINAYVNDRIGFREQAVQLYRTVGNKHLGFHHDKVLVGEEGWLYFIDELPDFTGTNLTPETVDRYVAILQKINNWCAQRDIQFVFAVGPNKSTIYPQYMPAYIEQADVTLLDALLEKCRQKGLPVICPKAELIANREQTELYQRLDTHWNEFGSRYMLNALTEHLALPTHQIPISPWYRDIGDLLDMLAIDSIGVQSLMGAVPLAENSRIENIPDTKHLVIHSENTTDFICYRDSFTEGLDEYYTYYFNGPLYWQFDIDFELVEQKQPKYLILSCVERYMVDAMEENAEILNH